jgi:hypothetical protein
MLVLSGGCSFIWGAELSDSPDYSGNSPYSRLTWPALWARGHGFDYATASQCGISNIGIARKVIDYIEHVEIPDFVIIQWTYPNRFELRFDDIVKNNYFTLSHWLVQKNISNIQNERFKNETAIFKDSIFQKFAEIWYSYVDNQHSQYFYFLKEAVFLGLYLKNKKIKFCFSNTIKNCYPDLINDISIQSLENQVSTFDWADFEGLGFIEWAEKNGHFDIEIWKHPDDSAHRRAYESIKPSLDQIFNI